ncbi:RNA polymerase sigma factor [Streptosporangium longisporum]|uniref:RNA polymerase sigma factor n=1 Tax=Streptosporangium longisporum TaxID=46187 RepID=A0ABN3XXB4_9ACTN
MTTGWSVETERICDAAIIERSRHEPDRFADLYDRHAEEIHRYVTRRLGRETADDITAETFLAAFRHRDRYDLTCDDARPWLYGMATNLIGKHRRAEVRFFRAIARTGVDPAIGSIAEEVTERVGAQSIRRQLADALARLNAGQRDVLLLVAAGGLDQEQVAAALGIAVGTVHSRLHRARKKMREALGGVNPTDPAQREGNR